VSANEPCDQLSVDVGVRDVRNVSNANEGMDIRSAKGSGDLRNHRSKGRGAQASGCEERWFGKLGNAFEVKGKQFRIVCLIKEGRSVFNEYPLRAGWELCPGAGPEGYGFDELFGGPGMVSGRDAGNHSADPFADFAEHGRAGGIVREKRKQRWLVRNHPSQEVRALARQPEHNRGAGRIAGDPRRRKLQMLDQRRKVGDILVDTALPWRTFALAVAATVVGQNPECLSQSWNDKLPVFVRVPRPMDKNQRSILITVCRFAPKGEMRNSTKSRAILCR
jgi:hypothetical protein